MSTGTISADGKSIKCNTCGRVSYNPNDVQQGYCGFCHVFHDAAKIYLTQWLCEQRHCILASAWNPDTITSQEIEAHIRSKALELKMNPWCGLCGSPKFHFEHGVMPYSSLSEALPHLYAEQEKQLASMALSALLPKPN